jgi:hypothetical protein
MTEVEEYIFKHGNMPGSSLAVLIDIPADSHEFSRRGTNCLCEYSLRRRKTYPHGWIRYLVNKLPFAFPPGIVKSPQQLNGILWNMASFGIIAGVGLGSEFRGSVLL